MAGAKDLAQYPQFAVSIAPDSAFTTPVTLAHVESFNMNDQYNVQTISDFDTVLGTIAYRILQERTVSVTFSVNVQLSDAAFKAVMNAAKAQTYYYLEISMADTNTSATTSKIQLGGYFSNRSIQGQMPIAKANITFDASEVLSDTLGG